MARRGELLDAIEQSRVYFHLNLPRLGREKMVWPSCLQGEATGEDNPRAFVWTGREGANGQEILRLFDDGNIAFERRMPPPSKPDDIITIAFDFLAQDTMGFVRLSAATYARAAKSAGTSATPYTVELELELPTGASAVALFRGDSYVQAIDFTRTARMKRSRVLVSCQVPVVAAEQQDAVAHALVRLLGGIADEFDLDPDGVTSSAKVLRLQEKLLRDLVAERFPIQWRSD